MNVYESHCWAYAGFQKGKFPSPALPRCAGFKGMVVPVLPFSILPPGAVLGALPSMQSLNWVCLFFFLRGPRSCTISGEIVRLAETGQIFGTGNFSCVGAEKAQGFF